MENAPEDLVVSLEFADKNERDNEDSWVARKGWETYYKFYWPHGSFNNQEVFQGAVLLCATGGEEKRIALPDVVFQTYNNLFTLDLQKGTLTVGQKPWCAPLLVALRVALTLLIEGAVFFLFGYRQKQSWLVFLIMNLVTQGVLNALITGSLNVTHILFGGWYFLLLYVPMELAVFLVEIIAYCCLFKEFSKRRAALYAFTANAMSLLLGGFIISYLPV